MHHYCIAHEFGVEYKMSGVITYSFILQTIQSRRLRYPDNPYPYPYPSMPIRCIPETPRPPSIKTLMTIIDKDPLLT